MLRPFVYTFWQNFRKIVGAFFSVKSKKTQETRFFFKKKEWFSRNWGKKNKKALRPFFKSYWPPTSCKISEKLLERFPRNCRYARMYVRTHKGDSIGPFGFQPGTNKSPQHMHCKL